MQIGPYRVEGELGRGGMAIVYRGLHPRTGQAVAIKLLLERDGGGIRTQRFLREVQTMARLEHPGILRVFDAGEFQGRSYLVTELVRGGSLEQRLSREVELNSEEAVQLGRALADAVEAAHQQGVVHRDLKPANVLFDGEGRPKVADFGLAKELNAEGAALTRSGVFLGTPGFCSPEQARGQLDRVGPASDVYGLGATLYACLTKEPPIQGKSLNEVLVRTAREEPRPLRALRRDVDPRLEEVVLRCLRKDPAERYGSAAALRDALDEVGEALQRAPRPRGRWGAAVGVGVGIGLGVMGWVVGLDGDPAEVSDAGSSEVESPEGSAPDVSGAPEISDVSGASDVSGVEEVEGSAEVDSGLEEALARVAEAFAEGAFERVVARCDVLLEGAPEEERLWAWRGRAHMELRDLEGAARDWGRACALAPDDPGWALEHSEVLRAGGRLRAAEREVERALERAPESALAWSYRARLARAQGRAEEGRRHVARALAADPESAFALSVRGYLHYTSGEVEEARADYDRALASDPDCVLALHNRGDLAFGEGRWAEAERDYDRALGLAPRRPALWFNRGNLKLRAGRAREAERDYDRALELAPEWGVAWLARGRARLASGLERDALEDFAEALERGADRRVVEVYRGEAWLALGEPGRALESGRAGGGVEAWWVVGRAHAALGEWASALERFDAVVDAAPERGEAWLERGRARAELGQAEAAREDLEAALERLPEGDPRAARARALLAGLR